MQTGKSNGSSHFHFKPFLILIAIRILVGLIPSYLHPDEFLQIPEPAASWVLQNHAELTWEFDPDFPLRSILPIFFTTGWPFYILKYLGYTQPIVFFTVTRLVFIVLSIFTDYFIYRLSGYNRSILTWLSFSHLQLFLTHSFSNCTATFLLSFCMLCIFESHDLFSKFSKSKSITLGVVVVFSIFTYPSFLFFIAPLGVFCLKKFSLKTFSLSFLAALVTGCACLLTDSIYYRGDWRQPVFTVFNFAMYNKDTQNLFKHGLHSRFLHLVINVPLLFGPILLSSNAVGQCVHLLQTLPRWRAGVSKRSFWLFLSACSGFLVLSSVPHQEARFLLPMYPAVLLLLRPMRRRMWLFFVCSAPIFAVFAFHQAGLVPCALHLSGSPPLPIVTWNTYMLPKFLTPHAFKVLNLGTTGHFASPFHNYYLISPVLPPFPNSTHVQHLTKYPSIHLDALEHFAASKGRFHLYKISLPS